MTTEPGEASVSRRAAVTGLLAAAAAAGLNTSAHALQAATTVTSRLVRLSATTYAFLQWQGPGQSNLSVSNCGVIVGPDSLLVIDTTGSPVQARRLLAAIRPMGKRIDRVVITHEHPDHIAGLSQFPSGIDIIAQDVTRSQMRKLIGSPAPAYWANNPVWAEPGDHYRIVLPNVTYRDRMMLHYGDTEVVLSYPGPAHTSGDTLVTLPHDRTMFMGDIAFFGVTPLNGSGYVADWIKVCDRVLADPEVVTIVPGHGPVGGKAELADMKGYLELLWREGRKRYDQGMSAGRAAADIDLGKYASWTDPDRIANNMARLYSEFRGTIGVDTDRAATAQAIADYQAARHH